jgi:hypothetical protein
MPRREHVVVPATPIRLKIQRLRYFRAAIAAHCFGVPLFNAYLTMGLKARKDPARLKSDEAASV